jgi:ATP-dependent DNA helicase RecG
VDRSRLTALGQLREGAGAEPITAIGTLGPLRVVAPAKGRGPARMNSTLSDGSGSLELVWFEGVRWLSQQLKAGQTLLVYGRPTWYNGRPQLVHPELERLTAEGLSGEEEPRKVLPVYRTTEALRRVGLDSRGLRRLVEQLLAGAPSPLEAEPLPEGLRGAAGLVGRSAARRAIHLPEGSAELEGARQRLKFDELFFFQLVLARRRALRRSHRRARPFGTVGERLNRFYHEHLPFALTEAQKRVVREVRADLARAEPMNRLVQGDVGSGKTMVAALTALIALDNGCQVALMAPTELLAEQHHRTLTRHLGSLGIEVALLTGSTRAAARSRTLEALRMGLLPVVVGTHALLEPAVEFAQLGLTIIDEQHKFGVMQRSALWAKASRLAPEQYPHNLALTATPIPRTLALTAYGEVDVSVIDELPPGRKPIRTVLRTESHRLRVLGFLQEQIGAGRQVYVVYPLVEESAKSDLLAATSGAEFLQRYFAGVARVGLIYGRLKADEKEAQMAAFASGQTQVLVATTVIEVGVDVPNATVMLVENPERFGLSQLHQLRGRVGRGAEQSYCILLAPEGLSGESRRRLGALVETTDGFRIAQVDLELRGPGDFLGTRQSGLPEFRVADVVADSALVEHTRRLAQQLVADDPELARPEHHALRQALEAYARANRLELLVA